MKILADVEESVDDPSAHWMDGLALQNNTWITASEPLNFARTTVYVARIRYPSRPCWLLLPCSLDQEIQVNELATRNMRKPIDNISRRVPVTQQSRLHRCSHNHRYTLK